MNREQMIAWLVLEGWVPIRVNSARPAHWIEHQNYGAIYAYLCDDERDIVVDIDPGWSHTSPARSRHNYVTESWSNFPTGHVALLYEEVIAKCT